MVRAWSAGMSNPAIISTFRLDKYEVTVESLSTAGTTGLSARNLRNCRQVALAFRTLDPRDLAVRSLTDPRALKIWQAAAKSSAPSRYLTYRGEIPRGSAACSPS